jgi:hypothetical protein
MKSWCCPGNISTRIAIAAKEDSIFDYRKLLVPRMSKSCAEDNSGE